jgi:hypothetical protein
MSDLEQELRAMADLTAPPAKTGLQDVLRRGRRRVLALRVGAVAGVVAVVAGAGFTALALRSVPTPAPLPLADGGPAVTTPAPPPRPAGPWATADLPTRTPDGTWSPGSSAPPAPGSPVGVHPWCDYRPDDRASQLDRSAPARPEVAKAVGEAVGLVAGLAVPSDLKTAVLRPGSPDASYFQWIDVTDVGGTGSVEISEGHFPGTPLAAADQDAFVDRNCTPPNRLVTDDGTVLQYATPALWEPFQSTTQTLRIYHPDGSLVEVEVRNYGSPDYRVGEDGTSFDRFGRGRPTLPLTVEQLMAIGEHVARVG